MNVLWLNVICRGGWRERKKQLKKRRRMRRKRVITSQQGPARPTQTLPSCTGRTWASGSQSWRNRNRRGWKGQRSDTQLAVSSCIYQKTDLLHKALLLFFLLKLQISMFSVGTVRIKVGINQLQKHSRSLPIVSNLLSNWRLWDFTPLIWC